MITHYDLFAGIGGFSIALEEVFNEPVRHIFCEWERFPTAVLRQHWPDGEFWGDIAELVAHTESKGLQQGGKTRGKTLERGTRRGGLANDFTIVTGGFPCQPFSHAGRRKGTADDRYQWPNMFAVIRNTKPEWVIAENVRGLVTWNEGLVLETVCADLESEGYEVQPFIIPAVAVGAPHRRDRVWIIGRCTSNAISNTKGERQRPEPAFSREGYVNGSASNVSLDTEGLRENSKKGTERKDHKYPDWQRNWQEVAFATCDDAVDDGLSRLVDGVPHSRAKWRKDSLKAYGNGIVPEVAMQIMKAIKEE